MNKIDLNCDLGESFGAYTIGMDEQVIPLISSANIACGFHASDPLVMYKTVQAAVKNGVSLGAHPGYPDLMGFGRRNIKVSPKEAEAYIIYQIGALSAFATACGSKLQHVKPHGAFYNMAAKDLDLSLAICRGIKAVDKSLRLIALSGSLMVEAAKQSEIEYSCEVFADRAYHEDGSLVSRTLPGAVITEKNIVVERVVRMVEEKKVLSITGKDISIQADTVCVHGDNPEALELVKMLRDAFAKRNISVRAK